MQYIHHRNNKPFNFFSSVHFIFPKLSHLNQSHDKNIKYVTQNKNNKKRAVIIRGRCLSVCEERSSFIGSGNTHTKILFQSVKRLSCQCGQTINQPH